MESITVSDIIEYLFCPRFIYFQYCLTIPQHEEKRYKVMKGREVHDVKRKLNQSYLRKKLGCLRKEDSVYLSSDELQIRGEVDQVLFLEDGTAAPFDYKFAEYRPTLFRTHKFQLIIYGLLIEKVYGVDVKKGYLCYTRSKNKVIEVVFKDSDRKKALDLIRSVLEIIHRGIYPKKTNTPMKCVDCCYRRICV